MTLTIIDSRLKSGTLTIDGHAFASQATNVRLVPKTDSGGDPLEVLSGDTTTADDETTWSLVVRAVQDFDDPAGFVNFSLTNAGDEVPYSWKPNSGADTPTFTGTVKVRPLEVGGDVNKRLTTDAEWPCTAAPTVTYPA